MKGKRIWMEKIFDSYGGRDKFFDFFAAIKANIEAIDESQTGATRNVSRVLHAHLMAESFLTRYLLYANPDHSLLKNAGLSFSQKVDLIRDTDVAVAFLIPGLRCLDSIRNRLAYDPTVIVTERDKKTLLAVPLFKEIREKIGQKAKATRREEAMSIMECFATIAGIILYSASSPDKMLLMNASSRRKPALSKTASKYRNASKRRRSS